MAHLVADVKGHEHRASGSHHPVHLREGQPAILGRQVDDGVQRHSEGELTVGRRQLDEVSFPELDLGVLAPSDVEHPG